MDSTGSNRGARRWRMAVGWVAALTAGLVLIAAALDLVGQSRQPDLLVDDAQASVGDAAETLGPHAEIVRPAMVIEVAVQPAVETRAFPGTIHPARSSHLAFRVGGPLIDLPVQEGDVVSAGTLLARIDPRDFELAVAELAARLDAAVAAQRLAELNHERQAQLVERGHTSRANLDQAVAERDRTAAEAASLAQQLAQARAALEDTRLVAPFDGRVARLHVEFYDYVEARLPAVTFHDISGSDLVVNLPETVIPRLPDLRRIEIELSHMPGRRYAATIREIASEQAVETGTYRTALRKSEADGSVPLAGLSGTAYLSFADDDAPSGGQVLVPTSAVFAGSDGGDFVWVVEGDPPVVVPRPVTVAGVVGDRARLAAGLADGERIVAYGVDFLLEGQRVRPMVAPLRIAGGAP